MSALAGQAERAVEAYRTAPAISEAQYAALQKRWSAYQQLKPAYNASGELCGLLCSNGESLVFRQPQRVRLSLRDVLEIFATNGCTWETLDLQPIASRIRVDGDKADGFERRSATLPDGRVLIVEDGLHDRGAADTQVYYLETP